MRDATAHRSERQLVEPCLEVGGIQQATACCVRAKHSEEIRGDGQAVNALRLTSAGEIEAVPEIRPKPREGVILRAPIVEVRAGCAAP